MIFSRPNFWIMKITPDERDQTSYYFEELFCGQTPVNLIGYTPNDGARADSIYADWKNISIGDLVIVMQGMGLIFGVVEILSDSLTAIHDGNKTDWFQYRRQARLIKQFDPPKDSPEIAARTSIIRGNAPNAKKICDYVWKLISEDYQKLKWNTLMENSKITDENKDKLKSLWEQYRSANASNYPASDYKQLMENWQIYKDKLNRDELQLGDYANRLSNRTGLPGGYLCNFLERTTKRVFGSSKPGNAGRYGLKRNDNADTYDYLERGEKLRTIQPDEAKTVFDSRFAPFLKELVADTSVEEKILLIEQKNDVIRSWQMLRKILALDIPGEFLYIYADPVIDRLFEEFVTGETDSILSKNRLTYAVVRGALGISSDPIDQYLLSGFLWRYATAKAIADDNDPNVILYGPPGTGKTYQVLRDLELLTQGNGQRVEHLQFHPSYTYEDFIEGIKPKGVTAEGNIRFEMVNGAFKTFCIKAKEDPNNNYYFIIDEINRANLSAVFGEILFCIEKDYRRKVRFSDEKERKRYQESTQHLLKTQYSSFIEQLEPSVRKQLAFEEINGGVYFGIPQNVYFIGMMNDVDKSIDTFDLALRRRFKWIRKDCDYEVIEEHISTDPSSYDNAEEYIMSCKKLNEHISSTLALGQSYEFGHSFFMKVTDVAKRRQIRKKHLEDLFNLHLRATLKEYLRAFYSEKELDAHLDKALQIFQHPISL